MQVGLGPFARQGIEARLGADLPAAVEIAVLYYVGKVRTGHGTAIPPSFLQNADFEAPVAEIDLNVGREIEAFLINEAMRSDTTVERLVAHSIFVYLAELDRLEEEGTATDHATTGQA